MTRTDNDSWDLASSVGATATMVAAARAIATNADEPLIHDPYAEPLVRGVGLNYMDQFLDGDIDFTDIDPAFTARRGAEGMAVRTRHFDRLFTDAADAGVRQAVILASGLDARAYRLPWADGTVVYELDQPTVIEYKTRTLAEQGAQPTARLVTIGIDLREDWPKALRDNGFDPSQPTAWIAEGLLIYLPSDSQDRLFDNITALSVPGSRLATEHVPDFSGFNDERSQRMSERMQQFGVDVKMADLVYHGDRTHVVEYLESLGWDVTAVPTRDAYAQNGFTYPDDEFSRPFSELNYVSAILR